MIFRISKTNFYAQEQMPLSPSHYLNLRCCTCSSYFAVRPRQRLRIPEKKRPCLLYTSLGQAIGRWGNYLNQEAHGTITDLPWAITVNDPILGMIRVHPTFLYESIWDLLVFGFLFFYEKKFKKVNGELLFLYLALYSVGRFFIEGLRTDSLMFMNMRVAQLISLALVIVGFGGIIVLRKKFGGEHLNSGE